jgi:predicted TIM-barrel fold metal-dependent hydrolase
MVWDGHIHVTEGRIDPADFSGRLQTAGVGGGILISLPPSSFFPGSPRRTPEERLSNLMAWTQASPGLHPFYWIDPTEANAPAQVNRAVERGVKGFKIICDRFYPGDDRAMRVYPAIAGHGKPILFHSGILWDGKPSSKYNRPVEFEILMEIPNLRFSLAHVSWPWCDELVAVYGKFQSAYSLRPDLSTEMFVDLTPGTPVIYRREVLTKLFRAGYDVAGHLIFGLDTHTPGYTPESVREWVDRDTEIYRSLGLDDQVLGNVFENNVKRFIGLSK